MQTDSKLDGTHWQLAEGQERKKPAELVPQDLRKQQRRVSHSSGRGRPKLVFTDCAESTKDTKLRLLHEKLLAAAQKILDEEDDQELVEMWKNKYEWFGPAPPDEDSLLSQNVKEFYQSLPQTSLIRTVLIKDLYKGYTQREIAELLDVTQARVSQALNTETKPLSYYLSSLGIPRNRCPLAEMYVLNWFATACPVPSGRNNRVFFGTPTSMYFEYRMWCAQCEVSCS
jgi:DNA-directed RNA polymerase specialized sigma24 family protein